MMFSLLLVMGISMSSPVLGQCGVRLCRFVSPSENNQTSLASLHEAELNGRCLTQCALQVLENDTMKMDFGLWTSYSDDKLMALSCVQYSELRQCVLGCTLETDPDITTVTRCRDACVSNCEMDCSNTRSCRSICSTSNCRRTFCRRGCEININQGTLGTLPSVPTSFALEARKEIGRFNILSATASQSAPEDELFAFIFKVEVSEKMHYVLQSSLRDILDLSEFSCKEVTLSVAVVNGIGSSQFIAYPSPIYIHGESFGYTSLTEDTRSGFLGHVVINFEWNKLIDRNIESVELSVIGLPPPRNEDACGINRTFSTQLPKNATSYELAASTPGELPLFGANALYGQCQYLVALSYNPISSGFVTHQFISLRTCTPTEPLAPKVSFLCHRRVDIITGLIEIDMNWNYEYIPLIEDAVTEYTIFYSSVIDGDVIPGNIITLDPQKGVYNIQHPAFFCADGRGTVNYTQQITNRVYGNFVMSDLCYEPNNQSVYNFGLQFRRNDTGIWWRNFPESQQCTESATALQPGKIDTDTITLMCEPPLLLEKIAGSATEYRVSFGLRWKPPLFQYGAHMYEISISDRYVNESVISNPFRHQVDNVTSVVITDEVIFVSVGTDNLFVQIRTGNEFFWSEYSDPFLVPLNVKDRSECRPGIDNMDDKLSIIFGTTSTTLLLIIIIVILFGLGMATLYKRKKVKVECVENLYDISEPVKTGHSSSHDMSTEEIQNEKNM